MTRHGYITALMAACLAFAVPALAQEEETNSDDYSVGESPPEELPPLPQVEAPAARPVMPVGQNDPSYFPKLPPSRLCTKRDLVGMWKLDKVYENPAGQAMMDFSSSPYQYYLFNQNDTYREYKGSNVEPSDTNVYRKLKQDESSVLEQYLVHESGIVYFYKDSAPVDSMACFIVANALEPFAVGEMLLMPPPDKATTHMARIYKKVFGNKAQTAAAKKAAARKAAQQRKAQRWKKIRQRRRRGH